MSLITWILTPALVVLPAIVTTCIRPSRRTAAAWRARRRLWIATAGVLAAFGLLAALPDGWLAWWDDLPRMTTFGKRPAELMWLASFPLWAVAMRALAESNPEYAGPRDPQRPARSASLVSRRRSTPLPPFAWLLPFVPWAVALVLTWLTWSELLSSRRLFAAIALSAQLPGLIVGPFAGRLLQREPEPLPEGGSEDLAAAYTRHRHRRIASLFALMLAISTFFAALVAAVVLGTPSDRTLGLVGGLGGTLIGILGAAIGLWMGTERARLRRRLDELQDAAG